MFRSVNQPSDGASGVLVAGADEVGRGPLAGSVVAAAVILDPDKPIEGLQDSKTLSATKRVDLDLEIRSRAIAFAIAEATVDEIDRINILHASMLAMQRAVLALKVAPQEALIDGNRCPELELPSRAIVKGDQSVPCISAASIIAKVYRDKQMLMLHELHPDYGFNNHKGYPTRQHLSALQRFGVLPQHRKSFAPVRNLLEMTIGDGLGRELASQQLSAKHKITSKNSVKRKPLKPVKKTAPKKTTPKKKTAKKKMQTTQLA